MKIQELRIGNYVKGTFTDLCEDEAPKIECVCEIIILDEPAQSGFTKWANSIEEKGKFVEEWDSLDGLVLNEEWLLKFGFNKLEDSQFYRKRTSGKYYLLTSHHQNYTEICVNDICGGQAETKYVHQLQNLYFVLTGEELFLADR